ncbi:hypothetical protein V8G54_002955 [Vigna mungo]|uniref:Uncharacterized protein n=1 Tax=Vigna mungo TaxID=3915 RepID=A0AAQ3PAY1_VIGMU
MNTRFVTAAANRCPAGTTAICADIAVTVSGSLRNPKNWFRKERSTHARVPKIHVRKVKEGSDGSSLTATVSATCSTGEFSTAGEFSASEIASLFSRGLLTEK